MALIPQEKPKQIALIVSVLALAGLYAVYAYVYTPRVEEVTALTERLTNLQDRNRVAQVTAARGGADLEERLAAYERHVTRLEQLIPSGAEVPALLTALNQEARRHRTEIVETTPFPPEEGEHYTRRSYEMVVVGEYHNVGRFLTALASLPRIVTPLDMEIEATVGELEGMDSAVAARFRIETYVLRTDRPAPAPEGGA